MNLYTFELDYSYIDRDLYKEKTGQDFDDDYTFNYTDSYSIIVQGSSPEEAKRNLPNYCSNCYISYNGL